MANINNLTVLVAGTVPSVIKYIANEFKEAGCRTERVMKSEDILEGIDEFNPDIVVIDIQMEEISTYDVIEKVKAIPKKKVYLALYSFFIDKGMAKESILHRLFASDTTHTFKNVDRPIKYLGIFNEDTFAHKISSYLASLDEE
ncbi:MAG TPA: response regulator [Candidatus Omnitrophota bacterium]|nr:response regulator [Candidatus Omnitrophota bacterium]